MSPRRLRFGLKVAQMGGTFAEIRDAWLEVAAQQIAPGELGGELRGARASIGGVLVVDHRALARRIGDEPGREPQLEHALARRRVGGGLRERVPRAKSHTPRVACDR